MASVTHERRGPSIWAFIFLGVGVIWLLAELDILNSSHLSVLARLWPVVLIAIGVNLLLARNSPALTSLIGIATIVLLLGLMFVGPALGLGMAQADLQSATYSEPLGDASSATITLSATVGTVNIDPLTDSNSLLEADIRHINDLQYDVSGDADNRIIRLDEEDSTPFNFTFNLFSLFDDDDDPLWTVGLNPDLPIDLSVNTGTGSSNLNLESMQISGLRVNAGTGSVNISLPNMEGAYETRLSTGTGSVTLRIADDSAINLFVNTGTGGATIDVPDNAAVRLDASVGTGSVNTPSWMRRVSGDEERFIGEDGIWESEGYSTAERQININFDGGTGSITLR
jgi:hypothetical protein